MPKIVLGILMIIMGAFYLIYNIRKIRAEFDQSKDFGKSILVQGFIGSVGFIVAGLILIIGCY